MPSFKAFLLLSSTPTVYNLLKILMSSFKNHTKWLSALECCLKCCVGKRPNSERLEHGKELIRLFYSPDWLFDS